MKKLFLICMMLAFVVFANAQLPGVLNRAKQRAENKVNEKINKKTDDAVDSVFKEKNAKPNPEEQTKTPEGNSQPATPAVASLKTYSKYDFVPGEKVIGFEDFSTGSIGDFPAGWNTNGSAEIVTIEGMPGRWLWLTRPGQFAPEFDQEFPEDFTFEFDLVHGIPINGGAIFVCLGQMEKGAQLPGWQMATNQFYIELSTANTGQETGLSRFYARKNGNTDIQNQATTTTLSDKYNPVHISIWRQKERVRVYVNQEKLWDIPRATVKDAKFNSIIFTVTYAEEVVKHYLGNLRVAVGAPDTRKKILEQSKWVTHGILFDVNSDRIKPESYGTLKEMASVLKENPEVKVRIVGHTDSDGADAANLDLSKRRAAAVKAALTTEFSIDATRMETDGKGESEPMDKATTPAAKANNRRVEFIKM